ncbi:hypothetical protein O0I10_008615 [Lichtheimia ornata]|uniref:Zn(2)-C6 fungal-type domain-containing protein n=1 Tax=Lichtheimia ornata TaxID=688661 RepID=A0AAD7XV93_9FUNG|nr:uncharacterized protein O0I10_008615 [Lichtheimia ornata]KAJ8655730.1 hypothetical protein O0I10_008615 [Lichtheimia ornata]
MTDAAAAPKVSSSEKTTKTSNSNTSNTSDSGKNSNLGAACFRCRGFRHACDRKKPTCTRCQKRGITCTYPEAAPTLKKLQKATETLGDRIRKFGDRLKSAEGMPKEFKAISLQRLAQQNRSSTSTTTNGDNNDNSSSPALEQQEEDTRSLASSSSAVSEVDAATTTSSTDDKEGIASTSSFSVYPCSKCYKDLQQCDLSLPKCSRCESNDFECVYLKTEPKASHVSQVLTSMNKVMDQWQESIDRMARDFAQKTRDFSQRTNNAFKMKPLQPFAWKITSTGRGLSVESNVNSYNDLSKLVDQFKRTMHITPPPASAAASILSDNASSSRESLNEERQRIAQSVELDDTSSIHTSSGFSFAVWSTLSQQPTPLAQDYPIDISDELTDNLVDLYCRSPCCSAIRLPIISPTEFLDRYRDPLNRPSKTLIYAVCAMAARNAFQLHVWSKRSPLTSSDPVTAQYNMGRALSIAYCLKARELLSECFDDASLDNCKAAVLLSYCTYQNGYLGVVYIYEWIAYNMARELGLYDTKHAFTDEESKLVWCLYYFNTWYRVLEGGSSASIESSQFYPCCPLPQPPTKPAASTDFMQIDGAPSSSSSPDELVDYYVWSTWYYMIKLQLLRHEVMTRLVEAQGVGGGHDPNLSLDLLGMRDQLEQFHNELPDEWRNPEVSSPFMARSSCCGSSTHSTPTNDPMQEDVNYHLDIQAFARSCILNVHIYYNINKILLYQVFFPSDHIPRAPFSVQCLYTCIDAAYTITQTLEAMVYQQDECNVPLLAFLFANIVYVKLLNYEDLQCQDFAKRCLQLSVDIAKVSTTYMHDFERSKTLVNVMEQDVYGLCGWPSSSFLHGLPPSSSQQQQQQLPLHLARTSSVDSTSDAWSMWSTRTSMSSPSYVSQYTPSGVLPEEHDEMLYTTINS